MPKQGYGVVRSTHLRQLLAGCPMYVEGLLFCCCSLLFNGPMISHTAEQPHAKRKVVGWVLSEAPPLLPKNSLENLLNHL